MNRSCLLVLALGSALVVVVGGLASGLYFAGLLRARPDVGLVGGTVLVYELDEPGEGEDFRLEDVVAAIKRRVDPGNLENISVHPAGERRIEITIPREPEGDHPGRVEQVKGLLANVGSLEFRILANSRNDTSALDAARSYFVAARSDDRVREELAARAAAGKPPPPPPG